MSTMHGDLWPKISVMVFETCHFVETPNWSFDFYKIDDFEPFLFKV